MTTNDDRAALRSDAQRNPLHQVQFKISWSGKRQGLQDLLAFVAKADKPVRFERVPEEESFVPDRIGAEWEYISRLWCEQPLKIVDAFRSGLPDAQGVVSVRLAFPSGEAGAEQTLTLTRARHD